MVARSRCDKKSAHHEQQQGDNEADLELTREYIVNNQLKALLIQEQRYEEMQRAMRGSGRP